MAVEIVAVPCPECGGFVTVRKDGDNALLWQINEGACECSKKNPVELTKRAQMSPVVAPHACVGCKDYQHIGPEGCRKYCAGIGNEKREAWVRAFHNAGVK